MDEICSIVILKSIWLVMEPIMRLLVMLSKQKENKHLVFFIIIILNNWLVICSCWSLICF